MKPRSIILQRTLIALLTVPLTLVAATALDAQTPTQAAHVMTVDAVFLRARQLVLNGNGAAGRVLIDSVVAATAPDSPNYPEALYWRATLAAESSDAEHDYRRIIVEYPVSRRANESLLQLGQLEAARGDRVAATTHLERFLMDNPQSPERAKIGLQVVRLAFDVNDVQRGCATLGRVLRDVPADAVETRNQLEYYSPRCAGVDTTRPPTMSAPPGAEPPPSTKPASRSGVVSGKAPVTSSSTSSKRATASAASGKSATRDSSGERRAAASTDRYTLQVAAYSARNQAEQLVKKLKSRGYEARIVGSAKPYRVRIGHFATRADATAEAKRLKAKKIAAVVTEMGADER